MLGIVREKAYHKYFLRVFSKEYAFIEWVPKALSVIHGHNGKRCNFVILNGSLNEKIFHKNSAVRLRTHQALTLGYIDDTIGSHQMINTDNKSKYSVHYYH